MCEETVFWDLNYSLDYHEMGTDQIKYKVSQVSPREKSLLIKIICCN